MSASQHSGDGAAVSGPAESLEVQLAREERRWKAIERSSRRHQKRIYRPKLDLEVNPFRQETQLQDARDRIALNKNPRLHIMQPSTAVGVKKHYLKGSLISAMSPRYPVDPVAGRNVPHPAPWAVMAQYGASLRHRSAEAMVAESSGILSSPGGPEPGSALALARPRCAMGTGSPPRHDCSTSYG